MTFNHQNVGSNPASSKSIHSKSGRPSKNNYTMKKILITLWKNIENIIMALIRYFTGLKHREVLSLYYFNNKFKIYKSYKWFNLKRYKQLIEWIIKIILFISFFSIISIYIEIEIPPNIEQHKNMLSLGFMDSIIEILGTIKASNSVRVLTFILIYGNLLSINMGIIFIKFFIQNTCLFILLFLSWNFIITFMDQFIQKHVNITKFISQFLHKFPFDWIYSNSGISFLKVKSIIMNILFIMFIYLFIRMILYNVGSFLLNNPDVHDYTACGLIMLLFLPLSLYLFNILTKLLKKKKFMDEDYLFHNEFVVKGVNLCTISIIIIINLLKNYNLLFFSISVLIFLVFIYLLTEEKMQYFWISLINSNKFIQSTLHAQPSMYSTLISTAAGLCGAFELMDSTSINIEEMEESGYKKTTTISGCENIYNFGSKKKININRFLNDNDFVKLKKIALKHVTPRQARTTSPDYKPMSLFKSDKFIGYTLKPSTHNMNKPVIMAIKDINCSSLKYSPSLFIDNFEKVSTDLKNKYGIFIENSSYYKSLIILTQRIDIGDSCAKIWRPISYYHSPSSLEKIEYDRATGLVADEPSENIVIKYGNFEIGSLALSECRKITTQCIEETNPQNIKNFNEVSTLLCRVNMYKLFNKYDFVKNDPILDNSDENYMIGYINPNKKICYVNYETNLSINGFDYKHDKLDMARKTLVEKVSQERGNSSIIYLFNQSKTEFSMHILESRDNKLYNIIDESNPLNMRYSGNITKSSYYVHSQKDVLSIFKLLNKFESQSELNKKKEFIH